jgi:acetyl esterase/lipase
MRNALSLVSALALATSFAVACGGGDTSSDAGSDGSSGSGAGATGGSSSTGGSGQSGSAGSGTAGKGTGGAGVSGSGGTGASGSGGASAGSAGASGGSAGTGAGGTGTAGAGGSGTAGTGTAGTGTGGTGTASTGTGGTGTAGTGTGGSSAGSGGSSAGAGGTGAGGAPIAVDPTVDGPYAIKEIDDTATVASTGDKVPVHAAYPVSGPTAGPYPVVLFAHGFQLPTTQYYGYLKRLASYGYVAVAPDFPAGLIGANHLKNAKDVIGGLDWAFTSPKLAGIADSTAKAGVSGHSLGGKLSILAASLDSRFGASITFDPVNSSVMCNPTDCPDAAALLPLPIPTGFVGEVTDASGGFMPCAPAADNFAVFYGKAGSPSLSVTVNGANHMSFLDDPSTCGFTCSFCNAPTADHTKVIGLSHAYAVAFYERHLRGNVAYDEWLTGAKAMSTYGALATITSKLRKRNERQQILTVRTRGAPGRVRELSRGRRGKGRRRRDLPISQSL